MQPNYYAGDDAKPKSKTLLIVIAALVVVAIVVVVVVVAMNKKTTATTTNSMVTTTTSLLGYNEWSGLNWGSNNSTTPSISTTLAACEADCNNSSTCQGVTFTSNICVW